jgi:hypothetical protein
VASTVTPGPPTLLIAADSNDDNNGSDQRHATAISGSAAL